MIISKIEKVDVVSIPFESVGELYMHPISLGIPVSLPVMYKSFETVIEKMLSNIDLTSGTAFVTIDQKAVKQNTTHRRGGKHVDGNFIFDWGGSGWLTGSEGRVLSPEDHKLQYANELGGTLIASSYPLCKAWRGSFDELPLQGGNCANVSESNLDSFILEPNAIYLMNSTCVHESLPSDVDIDRTLVRITLPPTIKV